MKSWPYFVFLFLACCKGKKEEPTEKAGSFPVLSFIKSQVAHIDTSLYSITKIVTVDSTSDTTYLKREEFRKEAKDFLELPDIATEIEDYTEEKSFDPLLNQAVLVYTAKEDDASIKKEQVYIEPDNGEGDKVKTFIIDQVLDGSASKTLVWNVDSHFQVISRSGSDGKTTITKVIWK
jgi:hypothetical protein